ncbi:hypothetical protein Patl1_19279 [Pistacia atlantica]|uniref:Uncharacterized protein n=1 Tax=Pistacia atlantica TaxID=434234 RepID=A0ACC1C2Z1_9ROSI|nr:hypothetical protein Patl1_19279 [Pistacia atlantica]
MTHTVGKDMIYYTVTNSNDDPLNPIPGTLRCGATIISRKVWIIFQRHMNIKLKKPLLISSFTTIDARGSRIHISGAACLLIYEASNVITHGLYIHHCQSGGSGSVIGPNSKIVKLGAIDTMESGWLQHQRFGSITIHYINAPPVLQSPTTSSKTKTKLCFSGTMISTILFNHFGPNCNQRMPR